MGNAYCTNCCRQNMQIGNLPLELQGEDELPCPQFAKSVKQMIDISARVKDVFLRRRSYHRISGTPHIAERKGSKLHFHYLFDNAAYYDGDWKNGLPHGHGRLIYDDGSIYEGCFNMGQAECKLAIFIRSDGSCYKGEVKHNKANGYGEMANERGYDRVIYKGEWKDDLPHGDGKEIFGAGNSHYEGQFVQGKKEGKGIYYWNLREYYSGSFTNNKMEGYGEYFSKSYTYKGNFKDGRKHGSGTMDNHQKKWKYDGYFRLGKMHGQGTYTWQDGTKFVGTFESNKRTQNGVLIMSAGKVINNPKLNPLSSTKKMGRSFEAVSQGSDS